MRTKTKTKPLKIATESVVESGLTTQLTPQERVDKTNIEIGEVLTRNKTSLLVRAFITDEGKISAIAQIYDADGKS